MGLKNTLHKSKLADFKEWLASKGYTSLEIGSSHEVLRWKVKGQAMPIIFNGKSVDHYSCNHASIDFVHEFIKSSKVIANDKVLMPKELTAENGAKYIFMGEFHTEHEVQCEDCEGCGYLDSPQNEDNECDCCDGAGTHTQKTTIDWSTIKDIYKMAVDNLSG